MVASAMGSKVRSGGVGDLLLKAFCFWLRCLGLRDSIDPAHDLTFFCFLLGFLVMDGLRNGTGSSSVGAIGTVDSGHSGDDGVDMFDTLLDFSDDAALTGRDLVGDDSPPKVSCPKKKYFLGRSLGVEGVSTALADSSEAISSDFRRCRPSFSLPRHKLSVLPSKTAPAVFGRASMPFPQAERLFESFEDGLAAPADMTEERLFETE